MKEIIILGTGGHAKVVFDILLKQNKYKVVGFVSTNENLKEFMSLPHYKQSELGQIKAQAGVVAIGDNFVRSQVVELIKSQRKDFEFITAVHPSAQIATGVEIAAGTVVMANVSINTDTQIGEHCILNTGCSVDHECVLSNFSSVAPHAVLGGNVSVGEFSAISIGAIVKHKVVIGANSIIGAGSLVLKTVGSFKIAYGSPCREIKDRQAGTPYL